MRHRLEAWWAVKKARLQETHWGYPEEFEERPFGACFCAHVRTQVANGMAARMVLYQYDFCPGPDHGGVTLNASGRKQLRRLAAMLQCNVWPVVIEPSDAGPQLDSARRAHVIEVLSEWMENPVPEEWVVVCDPGIRSLDGEEAIEMYDNLLRQTRMRGSSAGSPSSRTSITTTGSSNASSTNN